MPQDQDQMMMILVGAAVVLVLIILIVLMITCCRGKNSAKTKIEGFESVQTANGAETPNNVPESKPVRLEMAESPVITKSL